MKANRRALTILLLAAVSAAAAVAAGDPVDPEGPATWRFEIDNDIVFDSDDQLSNAWSLQKHGATSRRWEEVRGTPAFGKPVARWFLPETRAGLIFREGWSVGQSIQTPTDLGETQLIEDDVPYAASLATTSSWIAFNDRDFHGFGWLAGIVGPAALGEEVQQAVHEVVNSPEPRGWDNQLGTEWIFNLYYQRKRRLLQRDAFDLTGGFGLQAGNFLTGGDVSIEARFGPGAPEGFVYVPDAIGRNLSYHAMLPARPARSSIYGSIVARVTGTERYLFLDGNTIRMSHSIAREPWVGELIVSLHYQRRKWGVHVSSWLTTETVEARAVGGEIDRTNDLGVLMVEWRR